MQVVSYIERARCPGRVFCVEAVYKRKRKRLRSQAFASVSQCSYWHSFIRLYWMETPIRSFSDNTFHHTGIRRPRLSRRSHAGVCKVSDKMFKEFKVYTLPICPNKLCKSSFMPRCLFCYLWSL